MSSSAMRTSSRSRPRGMTGLPCTRAPPDSRGPAGADDSGLGPVSGLRYGSNLGHTGDGGDEGTRPPDPRDANAVLSQLSYIPTRGPESSMALFWLRPWPGAFLEDPMPYVKVEIAKGIATVEQKRAVIKGMTDVLVRELGRNPEYIFVVIDEIDTDNWGRSGTSLTELWQESQAAADE